MIVGVCLLWLLWRLRGELDEDWLVFIGLDALINGRVGVDRWIGG